MKQFISLIDDLVAAWKDAKEWQAKNVGSSSHWE